MLFALGRRRRFAICPMPPQTGRTEGLLRVGSGNGLITPTPKMLDLAYSLRAYLSIRNKWLQG